MDPTIVGVLVTAAGAIIVAAITVLGQQRVSAAASKVAETQAELDTTKMVMEGWEALSNTLVAELTRAREEARSLREELDACREARTRKGSSDGNSGQRRRRAAEGSEG